MGDFGQSRDKWVCPNDRELSLRAKLKTGWSVKTRSINSFGKPEPLNDKEQEAIMNVIKRAEHLDRVEQERVGRLVERLDNMKKNAMGNGTTQCVLCADEFGLLAASPLLCNDCKKAVCTKCGVDTVSAHKEPLWLCKICSETRETWKKSGAWFYKGLPKYILPGKKPEQPTRYARPGAQPPEHSTVSPVRSYNAWLQSKATGRSSSDKEYTDSSDEEFRTSKLSRRQTKRRYLSESVESNDSSPTHPQVANAAASPSCPAVDATYLAARDDLPDHGAAAYSGEVGSPIRSQPDCPAAALWYKPRRDADEDRLPARQDPASSAPSSYGNGRLPSQPRQPERTLPVEPAPQTPSPDAASKKHKRSFLRKLKRKEKAF